MLAQLKGYTYFVFILEDGSASRTSASPAVVRGRIEAQGAQGVAKAGLDKDEFWTVLSTEKKRGVQGFDIEKFLVVKPDGVRDMSDYRIETQSPSYDVAVALLPGENERPPKLPWVSPSLRPVAVKAIARALAWAPPGRSPRRHQPKKPRSAVKGRGSSSSRVGAMGRLVGGVKHGD